ncbi:MAG: tyrosine-type recombinase/integrase [Spirochaetes bacterium]|uniref:Tyrosine-type recombinase/integrase n=1 Tax=Candidatus Gallitreponema excrementavium TaxID=2840840 RepID=A0A9D9HPQ8_9SPIR|nr:tyrosine-type recombinase/integrase [Candidatus Gallitreponema excrementavium]
MKSDLPAKEEFLSLKSLSGYIGDFISYMQMARGMSPNTCKSYERDLILFAGFLMNGNIDQAVKDCFFKVSEVDAALVSLDSGVIKSFVSALTVKGYSPASINRILSGVRGLYTYLYRYGITSSNPGSGVKSLKQGKKLPSFLFEEEVKAVSDFAENNSHLWPVRDKAIILCLYTSGCRVSEMAGMLLKDLRADCTSIIVMGKGRKERRVFFSKEAAGALKEYLAVRKKAIPAEREGINHIFISKKGGNLSVRGIQYIISCYSKLQNNGKSFSPHSLRHSYATALVTKGADIRLVQELLGHASVSTTQRYSHITTRHLLETYNLSHPHGDGEIE